MTDMNAEWRDRATCANLAAEEPILVLAWAIRNGAGSKEAKKFCKTQCAVRSQCLFDALLDPAAEGLRAGFFFEVGVVRKQDARDIENEFGVIARTSQKQKVPSL